MPQIKEMGALKKYGNHKAIIGEDKQKNTVMQYKTLIDSTY